MNMRGWVEFLNIHLISFTFPSEKAGLIFPIEFR